MSESDIQIEVVPIERITVLNLRGRGRRVHREIIDNIEAVGLKRPITVSRRRGADGEDRFDLICGQGRIEAFQALGETRILRFETNKGGMQTAMLGLKGNTYCWPFVDGCDRRVLLSNKRLEGFDGGMKSALMRVSQSAFPTGFADGLG